MEIIHESNFAPGFRWPDSPCCSGTSRTLRLRRLPERPGPIRLLRQLVAGAESRTRGNVEAVYDEAEGGDRAPPQASGDQPRLYSCSTPLALTRPAHFFSSLSMKSA